MNSEYAKEATVVAIMPTENKSVTYVKAKSIIRNVVGYAYEDHDASESIGNPTNVAIYCREFSKEEKELIRQELDNVGCIPIYLQGTPNAFGEVNDNTIIVNNK